MALFPAFAALSNTKDENSPKDLEWLSNQSFRTDDALSIHQRATEKANEAEPAQTSRLVTKEREDKNHISSKKKKKEKEKKKKKRKKHKKSGEPSPANSGSDSDTIYPSDLLKKGQDEGSFVWLDDLQTPTDRPFCVDRRADRANWEYKSLYRGDIARYKRKGSSSLGLNPRSQAVSWAESGPEKKKSDRRNRPVRYFSPSVRQHLRSDGQPVLPSPPPEGGAITSPFIPVPPCLEVEVEGMAKGQSSWVNPLGVYDSATSLWLQGKGKAEHGRAEEPPPAPRDPSAALLAERVEDFNRRLRENPEDTHAWLRFVRFQDEVASGPGAFGDPPENETERRKSSVRATLEKKVAILDRAVDSNPGCVELKLERLRLCRELWEPAVLLKEWKKLVFVHPNSAPLWKKYLLFVQSHFSTFSVSKVNGVYGKCLSTLAAVQDGSMVSHDALPGTEEHMLGIFLQQCHFLRQAGHSEKAVCLFQGMLDFTFFKPDTVKDLPTRQQVEFFETFWDSGEPRVGERGARGWRAWMTQQERGGWLQPNEPDDEDDEDQEESEVKDMTWPKWKIWLDVETSREAVHWLPWRPDKTKGQSVEDCEDPDRQVLFDDIGPSMIRLVRPDLQLCLLLSFLHFLGLPADPSCYSAPSWSVLLDDLTLLEEVHDQDAPLTSYDLLVPGVSPVGHMTSLQGTRKGAGLCKQGEEFLDNMFQMILPLLPAQERAILSLHWIQYEKLKVLRCARGRNKKRLKAQGKRSKRLAKRLLKEPENRGRLSLWREYAHLEWLLGNLEEARKVFDTALGLGVSGGLADPALCDLCLLYAQLEVEEAWRVGSVTSSPAVYVLAKLAEGSSYAPFSGQLAPVAVLKARKTYEQAVESYLPGLVEGASGLGHAKKPRRVKGLVGCYALFQYLTVGIDATDAVYNLARERLEQQPNTAAQEQVVGELDWTRSTALECEALAVQRAALLRHHTDASVYPLGHLRLALTSALVRFPSSAPLWRLYVQVENRYHSAGRARRFFHSVTKVSASVVPRLFAISAEQRRKQLVDSVQRAGSYGDTLSTLPENGLSNRIRCLFENAIATEHGVHCPLLWRMYMNFLVSEGKVETGRGIFYKALQDIPWAKGLYMDAAQLFPDHVQEFLDLMTEKELRLRVPMEEVDILLED
uniref:NRDE-2, necessary for RNA interference, domain containing n=1 Tax=Esox lucius TaxID=8010 RepID=A0A6Q2YGS9_ESOLU